MIRDRRTHVDQSLEEIERRLVSKLDESGRCCLVEVLVDWQPFAALRYFESSSIPNDCGRSGDPGMGSLSSPVQQVKSTLSSDTATFFRRNHSLPSSLPVKQQSFALCFTAQIRYGQTESKCGEISAWCGRCKCASFQIVLPALEAAAVPVLS